MTLASERVLDQLPADRPLLAAVFESYAFDPRFFEDHMLRAVLRLQADPVEEAARFHGEARRALQETPVAAIVDAGERQPGRRLPYDLLEVSDTLFHPKVALLLYEHGARLLIGSGNLTFGGYSGNTELFSLLELKYDNPEDVSLLLGVDTHLARITARVRHAGTQLQLVRDELRRRVGTAEVADNTRFALLDSLERPIMEQIVGLLPDRAQVQRVGLLAPFYEKDDADALDDRSVLGRLTDLGGPDLTVDIGVLWDNAAVHSDGEPSDLEVGLGHLWVWASEDDNGTRCLEHLVPEKLTRKRLHYLDEHGARRRWDLEEAEVDRAERRLWQLPTPLAYAPSDKLRQLRQAGSDVRLWLHPATRLIEGRPVHRPLHAKALAVVYQTQGAVETLVVVGSANMSRRALLLPASPGAGNVEVDLAFKLSGAWTLPDLLPELVLAPEAAFQLQDRVFPENATNWALCIRQAHYDPSTHTVTVTFDPQGPEPPAWTLAYDGEALGSGEGRPDGDLEFSGFVLQPSSAELMLHVAERDFAIPLLVTDLVALPAGPQVGGLGLEELLMLLGRRIGEERALELAEARQMSSGDADVDDALAAFFGRGFGPTDIFRAWWAVAEDLSDPSLSVQAFRVRMEGPLSVGAAWRAILAAGEAPKGLDPARVWFFGAELLRTLEEVELHEGVDRPAKRALLDSFLARLRDRLADDHVVRRDTRWSTQVRDFYLGGSR